MEPTQLLGISIFLGIIAVLALIIFIKTNIVLCQPNELVVLAGKQRKLEDGGRPGRAGNGCRCGAIFG